MSINVESRGANPRRGRAKSAPTLPGLPRVCKLAANARTKQAGVLRNPRPGAELLYGVGSAYEPP
jgi:hypothetical protein